MPETTNPIEAIFLEALEKPASEQWAFLKQRCGGNEELLCQVTAPAKSGPMPGPGCVAN